MEKTHAINICIVPSNPSVGRKWKGCLIETDVGWLALEWAIRKAWDATFQSSCAGQENLVRGQQWGSVFHVEAQHVQRPEVGNHRMGKSASRAQ